MVVAAVAAADANGGGRSGKKGLFCVRSWRGERELLRSKRDKEERIWGKEEKDLVWKSICVSV